MVPFVGRVMVQNVFIIVFKTSAERRSRLCSDFRISSEKRLWDVLDTFKWWWWSWIKILPGIMLVCPWRLVVLFENVPENFNIAHAYMGPMRHEVKTLRRSQCKFSNSSRTLITLINHKLASGVLRSRDYILFSLNREHLCSTDLYFWHNVEPTGLFRHWKKHHVIAFDKAFKTNVKKCNAASTSP